MEPLALDVVRDPISDLGGRLDRYVGHLSDRMNDFGGSVADPSGPSLLRSLSDRWSMPGAGAGLIEVFDGSDFGGLVRHWGNRAGYGGHEYDSQSPFVIPVDPIEHVEGISGAQLRRQPDRRRAMRPVALRSQRPSARPRATERWRPVSERRRGSSDTTAHGGDSTRFSAYPAAMGQAGAIDATLLRFPAAQAEISDGPDRAVVTDRVANSIGWAPTASRTPAVQAAERLSADLAARLAPAPATEVGAWLVPASSPAADDVHVQRMQRARLAKPRRDARVPIAAFVPRIGRITADADSAQMKTPWDGDAIPGALIEPSAQDSMSNVEQPRQAPSLQANRTAKSLVDVSPRDASRSDGARVAAPARILAPATEALSAEILERTAALSGRTRVLSTEGPKRSPVQSRAATPWTSATTPAPGRALFVPAALAQIAMQMGETVRPGDAPRADWPWAPTDSVPAPSFVMADQAADGVLVEAAAQSRLPDSGASTAVRADRTPSVTREKPARPPDSAKSVAQSPSKQPATVTASVRQTAMQIAARVEARLTQILSVSATQPSPIALSSLLTDARSGAPDAVWQAQIAADPALAQVLQQIDRLTPRTSMTAPLPSLAPNERPPSAARQAQTARRSVLAGASGRQTRLEDGLSVLSGGSASATLFSPSWSQASPIARALLGAAGFGPEAHQQPGPAFSFGERLAAVAADLSARHGLSTEASVAGGLDAGWFSEPTGTLVLPMTPAMAPDADGRSSEMATSASRGARLATTAMQTAATTGAAPDPNRTLAAGPKTLSRALAGLPSALQAALRGAQRRGPTARLRPVPRLSRVNAPIAPESMAMLTQVQTAPPAIVEILARAERLLGGGDAAISALAQSADMPSLITLARLADAPEAMAALSDVRQAPGILRALARLSDPQSAAVGAKAEPLRALKRLDQPDGQSPDVFESLDAALVEIAAETAAPAVAEAHAPVREVRQEAVSKPTPARLAESLKTLTNALPAALRAALATASAPRRSGARRAPPPTRVSVPTQRALAPTRRLAATSSMSARDSRAPGFAALSSGDFSTVQPGFAIGAIGQVARRAVDWAQLADAAAPQAFVTLASQTGDIAQSPVARRVLAPRAMLADELTPNWVFPTAQITEVGASQDQPLIGAVPGAVHRTRAAPIGVGGRRSAAFAHALDGIGQAPTPATQRSIWQAADAWTFIASTDGPSGAHRSSQTQSTSQSSTLQSATTARRAQVGGPGATARSGQRTAMGVPGGKLRWPQATFNWVQAAADTPATDPRASTAAPSMSARGAAQIGRPAQSVAQAMAGIASLRSLAVSDRILVQSLDGLGVFGRSPRAAMSVDPLRPAEAATPRMALELALPGTSEAVQSGAERFADQTFARQVPITGAGAPKASSAAPELDVDWVQPVTAVAAEAAQLAPHLRSPGNIGRALDVWVDAVKAEAVRSPAAARQALGSVGQLIAQFSTPSRPSARVRSSNALRGSIFGGRSTSPVTIEPPRDGDARPALIRPGEQAAQQALRKGTDTVQSSQATTTEEARHKNSEQTDELIPPEEVERLAAEVIDRIKRELEFDAARMGEDGWD